MTTLKIYVADLAAYNNAILRGVWIEATDAPSDINDQIQAMLSESPFANAESYAIHDFEGFEGYDLGEHEGVENVYNIACFIEEQGEIAARLLANFHSNIEEAKNAFDEHYCGCFTSIADFAEDFSDQTDQIPKDLRPYINFEAMGNDMDVFAIETGSQEVHIFWNH